MQQQYTRSNALAQPESPALCPCCGHRPAPYDARLSALLDTVALLMDVVADLKAGIEEVAS